MRISDWSSDVCSSDLENISCTFSGIRDHGRPGIGETHSGMAGSAEAKPAAQRGDDWLHTALLDRIVPYAGAAELSAYRSIDEHGAGWQHRQYDVCTGGLDRRLPAFSLRRAGGHRSCSSLGFF